MTALGCRGRAGAGPGGRRAPRVPPRRDQAVRRRRKRLARSARPRQDGKFCRSRKNDVANLVSPCKIGFDSADDEPSDDHGTAWVLVVLVNDVSPSIILYRHLDDIERFARQRARLALMIATDTAISKVH